MANLAREQEKISYRVYIAGSTVTHPILGSIPAKGIFPILPASTGTGTITTLNTDPTGGTTVLGTGTLFVNEGSPRSPSETLNSVGTPQVEVGQFITDSTGYYLRRIMRIHSDVQLNIEAAFPTSQSGINLYVVRPYQFKKIYCKSVGTGNAVLQEQTFVSGDTFQNNGSPISYDTTGSNAAIEFQLDL